MRANPARVPEALTLRKLGGGFGAPGEDKYMINRYLRERGDANIKTNADLITKATFYDDPNFPNRQAAREQAERATALDTSARMHTRFALQTMLLQCMQEQKLDALVAPMSTVPPRKLLSPREPPSNGRTPIGWSMFGQQGFPVIAVPAGFTTAVWDRERDGNETRLVGPIRRSCPSASISSPGRSVSRCCSASRPPMKPRRRTGGRPKVLVRCHDRGDRRQRASKVGVRTAVIAGPSPESAPPRVVSCGRRHPVGGARLARALKRGLFLLIAAM